MKAKQKDPIHHGPHAAIGRLRKTYSQIVWLVKSAVKITRNLSLGSEEINGRCVRILFFLFNVAVFKPNLSGEGMDLILLTR